MAAILVNPLSLGKCIYVKAAGNDANKNFDLPNFGDCIEEAQLLQYLSLLVSWHGHVKYDVRLSMHYARSAYDSTSAESVTHVARAC